MAASGPDPLGDAMCDALDAVARVRPVLRSSADPVAAAVDSALSCAAMLLAAHRQQPVPRDRDVESLREALHTARALVGELTFAVRDRYRAGPDEPTAGPGH